MFRLLFLSDSFRHPVHFPARILQLALRLFLLRTGHLRQRFGKTPPGTTQDGERHIQITLDLFDRRRLGCRRLPLGFQKQFRLGENAFADHARAFAPGRIQLPGLPRIATMCDESRRHARAVVGADSRHRHQMLHRHLRREFSFAHLLLDRFRQQLHQRQPPRHPTGAAVEAARQFIETIAEALLHLRQQPALFERAFLRTEPQRPRQQQSFGFAHRPDRSFYRIPAKLFQRGHALVAIDHQVMVRWPGGHYDNGGLLTAIRQRRQQPALPVWLADSQMFPSPVELVKLQLHRRLLGIQYAGGWNWSFSGKGEVCWEVPLDQEDTGASGLSRHAGLVRS
jgi:hypothetical protein